MKQNLSANSTIFRACIIRVFALSLITATLAIGAAAQVRIGNITIGKPKPTPNPQPNKPPTVNSPNTNGTKTPPVTSPIGNNTTATSKVSGAGATREQVNAFKSDLRGFINSRGGGRAGSKGLHLLKAMYDQQSRPNFNGCGVPPEMLKAALDDGAAFGEIIQTKYTGVENPTWTLDADSMIGDWRRAVETRSDVLKNCVTVRFSAVVRTETENLEKTVAEFKANPTAKGEWAGFMFSPRALDGPAATRAELVGKYKDSFAAVGVTMPDESIFAAHDAAFNAKIEEARKHAGLWKWYWNYRDPMVESAIRSRFPKFDPKGTIVKIGLMHNDWQIDGPSGGIPRGRYKRAYVLYRRQGFQPCVLTSFSYEQTYAGGGKFVDSVTTGFGSARLQNCN